MKKILFAFATTALLAAGCNSTTASQSPATNLQANNITSTPATSDLLNSAQQPTYSGADLANLRLRCQQQAQSGFSAFVQRQNQISNEMDFPDNSYSVDAYHFNQKLGACLLEADGSFTDSQNQPSDTTYLVNTSENKTIMYCTTYGNPVTSSICYDDQGDVTQRGDWTEILSQYMNE